MSLAVSPFLMFEGAADEAMELYVSIIPGAKILSVTRYGAEGPGAEGSVAMAEFSIGGAKVRCSDSPIKHEFTFTPAMSLFVDCTSEAEVARIVAALAEGGEVLMPIGAYGFSRKFAWVNDRFGVSWQVNLP